MGVPLEKGIGTALVDITGPVAAGSHQSFTLTYIAGFCGIDDSGSLKICFRFATDQGTSQFDDPAGENYVHVQASNGAKLLALYDTKMNIRPWGKTIYIKVQNGYLGPGDTITLSFGDKRGGSPGFRMQTFCEDTFELKVLVDPVATCVYNELESSPTIRIVPGEPKVWKAVIPSQVEQNKPFNLRIKAEDKWGNPTSTSQSEISLDSNLPLSGLPPLLNTGDAAEAEIILPGLAAETQGTYFVSCSTPDGQVFHTNPMRVVDSLSIGRFWGDLHGQSEETIGSNSVEKYFSFARDKAWLDFAGHQGNDFQVTPEFWQLLQKTTKAFNKDGRFVTFPGYEWSGNTGLGGDHNVYFREEGYTIHRSSHALVDNEGDVDSDCYTAAALLKALPADGAMVFAHVGGRYARFEAAAPALLKSVEIHSAWGTFEWLLRDAFDAGLRVGIVSNSDGHKGRPGASYPGASLFGSYGGLTCVQAKELAREEVWNAYQERRHYATTGARIYLDLAIKVDDKSLPMGSIIETNASTAEIEVDISPSAPVNRIEILNRGQIVDTIRPKSFSDESGSRVMITWSGAAFRGRGRQTDWTGDLVVERGRLTDAAPFNFHNPLKPFTFDGGSSARWSSYTTGGIAGCILTMEDPSTGKLIFHSPHVDFDIDLDDLAYEPRIYDAGGLERQVRIERLPSENLIEDIRFSRTVDLSSTTDNPVYVKVVQENGHMAWSSPVYLVRL
jgi:hypothetical protein